MKINDLFRSEVSERMKIEISESYGNEVLFFCWLDDEGKVNRYEVIARGSNDCVNFPMRNGYLPDLVVHNHPDGILTPSDADIRIAGIVADRGTGFVIVNNEMTDLYIVIEPVINAGKRYLDTDRCVGYLSKEGIVSSVVKKFEEREGQKKMVRAVCEAFNTDSLYIIEAGTGIGKTFAYLIPSIEWAINNKERVVVSTNTINLQEQLVKKDLPTLENAFKTLGKKDFKYILMKGRGNYVCLNRLYEISKDLFSFIDDEEEREYRAILDWVETTDDGSISDLNFRPSFNLWEKINSKPELCLGGRCRYFSKCFVNRVKREAIRAHIVVTNHHYFLADSSLLDSGFSILPGYDKVIFDEAHRLEDSATSFFTHRLTKNGTGFFLNQIYRVTGRRVEKGYIPYLKRTGIFEDEEIYKRIIEAVTDAGESLNSLFEKIEKFFIELSEVNGSGDTGKSFWDESTRIKILEINDEVKDTGSWNHSVISAFRDFYGKMVNLQNKLVELSKKLRNKHLEVESKRIEGYIARIIEILETTDIFLKDEDYSYVRWIERGENIIGIVVAPVEVGDKLADIIFRRAKTTILTSATLSVGGSFDFIKERLGLPDETFDLRIESPFDYNEQMAIVVPLDVDEPDRDGYFAGVSDIIERIVRLTVGSTLVLFTSYYALNRIYETTKSSLKRDGFIIFKQGDLPRDMLLREFKIQKESVLFGTESFWEGIDVPGEDLKSVVITKLPFKVPSDPVIKARIERLNRIGKSGFMNYLLPLAVIKMKQGVGRLIRQRSDKGIIFILDRRVLSKNYGSIILRSLPEGKRYIDFFNNIVEELKPYVSNNSLTN